MPQFMADYYCQPLHTPPLFYFSLSTSFYLISPSHFMHLCRHVLMGSMSVLRCVSLLREHNTIVCVYCCFLYRHFKFIFALVLIFCLIWIQVVASNY